MRIHKVVFDFDGTLFDSFPNAIKAVRCMFREMGRPFRKRDERIIRDNWGDSMINIVAALFPEATPATRRRFVEHWMKLGDEREKHSPSKLIPGTNASLKALREMGLGIAIATNRSANKLYEVLLRAKLRIDLIDFIIAWNTSKTFAKFLVERKEKPVFVGTPFRKPDARYLKKLNRHLFSGQTMPHEVAFCGDAIFDALTAKAGGYNFIPVLTGPAGNSNAWWEVRLAELNVPPLAIASSIKDVPLLIKTLNKVNDSEETPD